MKSCAIFVLFSVGLLMSAEAGDHDGGGPEEICKDHFEIILNTIGEFKHQGKFGEACEAYVLAEKPASVEEAQEKMKEMCVKFHKEENQGQIMDCARNATQQVIDAVKPSEECEAFLNYTTENFCKE